jgi:hypothetical protein
VDKELIDVKIDKRFFSAVNIIQLPKNHKRRKENGAE